MPAETYGPLIRRVLNCVWCVVVVLCLVGLRAVSYAAFWWVFIGCIGGVVIARWPRFIPHMIALLILVLLVAGLVDRFVAYRRGTRQSDTLPIAKVTTYKSVARADDKYEHFKVTETGDVIEEIVLEEGDPEPAENAKERARKVRIKGERTISPVPTGWFVREVQFRPFDVDAPEYAGKTVFGEKGAYAHLEYEPRTASIDLLGLSEGVFVDARDAKVEPIRYGHDKPTIRWPLDRLDRDRGPAFEIVAPPLNLFRWAVDPFLRVRSWGEFWLVVLGLLLAWAGKMAWRVFESRLSESGRAWWRGDRIPVAQVAREQPPPTPGGQGTGS